MTDSRDPPRLSDADTERALGEALRANSLSPQAMQRIRHATEAQWRAHLEPQAMQHIRRATEAQWRAHAVSAARRRWLPLAGAASIALLALVIGWAVLVVTPTDRGALFGQLAQLQAPGVLQTRYLGRDVALTRGSQLRSGETLSFGGDSRITLAGGGNLRVARASSIEVAAANAVRLLHGELYVDIPPAARRDPLLVMTPAGEFRHLGTQFAIAIVGGSTRLRVREGTVQWHAGQGDSPVVAGTEILIDLNQVVTRRTISTAGRDWAWAERLAPDIDVENRPLLQFLDWFARETGRKLVLADADARSQAATIRIHGNLRGLTALEALSAVMASTSLRFELPEGSIRVSSVRELAPPST